MVEFFVIRIGSRLKREVVVVVLQVLICTLFWFHIVVVCLITCVVRWKIRDISHEVENIAATTTPMCRLYQFARQMVEWKISYESGSAWQDE